MTQMPVDSVKRLMAAKASQLNSWQKTIRNGVKAAKRDQKTYYVGFTSLTYTLTTDITTGGAFRYQCDPDGNVFKI